MLCQWTSNKCLQKYSLASFAHATTLLLSLTAQFKSIVGRLDLIPKLDPNPEGAYQNLLVSHAQHLMLCGNPEGICRRGKQTFPRKFVTCEEWTTK